MTKIRKQRKRKVYKYDVNRKKMRRKMKRTPKILCEQIKGEWDKHRSVKQNLAEMGLSYDPNDRIPVPVNKPPELMDSSEATSAGGSAAKMHVVEAIEADAKAPREKKFRLPNSQVYWLTKCIDKHGEDYKAMAKDKKLNHFQETWKQIRAKINVFKKIPEQYEEYLKKKAGVEGD